MRKTWKTSFQKANPSLIGIFGGSSRRTLPVSVAMDIFPGKLLSGSEIKACEKNRGFSKCVV